MAQRTRRVDADIDYAKLNAEGKQEGVPLKNKMDQIEAEVEADMVVTLNPDDNGEFSAGAVSPTGGHRGSIAGRKVRTPSRIKFGIP